MMYPRNFLRRVICRLDFPVGLGFHEAMPTDLKTALRSILPVMELRPVRFGNVAVMVGSQSPGPQVESDLKESIEWVFHSQDRTRHLTVGPNFVALEYERYVDFPGFHEMLKRAVDALAPSVRVPEASRFGLRFINEVDLPDGQATEWSTYIQPGLTASFGFPPDLSKATRLLSVVEFALDDVAVRFQYGMPNPDFPAPIRRRLFVLDYDAYSVVGLELAEAPEMADRLNKTIYELFEASIDDGLRQEMSQPADV